MDVRLEDGTIVRNVPDGTTRSQLMAKLARNGHGASAGNRVLLGKPADYGATDAVIHGATLGADNIAAGVGGVLANALTAPFSDKVDFSPIKAFEQSRKTRIDQSNRYAQEHPVKSTVGGIVGALTSLPGQALASAARAPTVMARAIQAAKAAVPAAAAQGALGSREWSDVPGNAALAAGTGAALSAAFPVAGAVMSPIAGGVKRLVSGGEGLAAQRVMEALQADNASPVDAGRLMDAARGRGVPRMLADTGENTRRLTGAVYRQPGSGRTIVRDALVDRQKAQGERLQNAITRDLGPVGNVKQQSDDLIEQARKNAAPLYEKFRSQPAVGSSEIEALVSTPAGKAALARARTIAANKRQDPEALGFALDRDGNVVLNPVPVNEYAGQAQARSGRDALAGQLADVQARAQASLNPSSFKSQIDKLTQQLQSSESGLGLADQALSAAPTAGVAGVSRQYKPETIDFIKRGLDDVLEDYRDPVTRKMNLNDVGRSADDVRKSFISEADRLYPDTYAAARKVYAGSARERDALELGASMVGKSDGDIQRALSNMSDSEKSQFALGMRSKMSENLNKRTDGADKVGYLYNSPQRRETIAQAAGPSANMGNFTATLADEDAAGQTYRAALTGSPTAVNLADDQLVGDPGIAMQAAGKFLRGAHSGGIVGGLANLVQPLIDANKFGTGRVGDRVREGLASLLTETDPAAFQAAIQGLQDLNRRNIARTNQIGRVGLQANNVTGSLVGNLLPAYNQP